MANQSSSFGGGGPQGCSMRCESSQSVRKRREGGERVYFCEFEFDASCSLPVGDGGVGEEWGVTNDGSVRIAVLVSEPFAEYRIRDGKEGDCSGKLTIWSCRRARFRCSGCAAVRSANWPNGAVLTFPLIWVESKRQTRFSPSAFCCVSCSCVIRQRCAKRVEWSASRRRG